jgi:hypothetical protein
MDKLTGSGNILNDGNRVNSVERAKNRLEGVNVDEKRKEAERKINLVIKSKKALRLFLKAFFMGSTSQSSRRCLLTVS